MEEMEIKLTKEEVKIIDVFAGSASEIDSILSDLDLDKDICDATTLMETLETARKEFAEMQKHKDEIDRLYFKIKSQITGKKI